MVTAGDSGFREQIGRQQNGNKEVRVSWEPQVALKDALFDKK